jgi:FkbM family methyltransferase
MDVISAAVRITADYSPSLAARIEWLRESRGRDLTIRLLKRLIRPGDVVVDVGANWGFYAWQLVRLVGARGHVHAIEPNPAMAPSLNAIRGRRANLSVHLLGVSDTPGEAELHIPVVADSPISALGSLAVPRARAVLSHQRVRVRLERLDTLLCATLPAVTFMKCDVEGHELAVLGGAEQMLRQARPALLIEIEQRHQPDGADIRRTFDHLLARDYVGYAVRADGLARLEDFDTKRDQLAWLGPSFMPYGMPAGYVHDFLFVRPETDVSDLMAPRDSLAAGRSAGSDGIPAP